MRIAVVQLSGPTCERTGGLLDDEFGVHSDDAIFSVVRRRFGCDERCLFLPAALYDELRRSLHGNLSGKRILDIGCGSTASQVDGREEARTFEPWLCRGLAVAGAIPVGIDVQRSVRSENFETHVIDACRPGFLLRFADRSFDAVVISGLTESATFRRLVALSGKTETQVLRNIVCEARRVLRRGGPLLRADY